MGFLGGMMCLPPARDWDRWSPILRPLIHSAEKERELEAGDCPRSSTRKGFWIQVCLAEVPLAWAKEN